MRKTKKALRRRYLRRNIPSLSDLLVEYAEACKPVTEEQVEQKTREIFGDGTALREELSARISGAIQQVLSPVPAGQ